MGDRSAGVDDNTFGVDPELEEERSKAFTSAAVEGDIRLNYLYKVEDAARGSSSSSGSGSNSSGSAKGGGKRGTY